jgi:hypothetical protein
MDKFIERLRQDDIPIIFKFKDLKKIDIEEGELKYLLEESVIRGNIYNIYEDIFTLTRMYRRDLIAEGVLARMIMPNSYVSLLYVLSKYNWIPEASKNVFSVCLGKNIDIYTRKFEGYIYYNICDELKLRGVHNKNTTSGEYFEATLIKALCDYICRNKCEWKDVDDANDYLRIPYYMIEETKIDDIEEVQGSFKIKDVEDFIEGFKKDLKLCIYLWEY